MHFPHLAYGTPRKLPKPAELHGRVVVLDVAFAADMGRIRFANTTERFIKALGPRLAMWIDHHDHQMHHRYASDPRFVLRTKAQHGACPELVTPERVTWAGHVDTICCHVDFDGLCSAAKWIRGGHEPYAGADADARAIDTRMGEPSPRAALIDQALRARPRDDGLKGMVVRFLAQGAADLGVLRDIEAIAGQMAALEAQSQRLAQGYRIVQGVAICDARQRSGPYEKTSLLLLGQERAAIAVVHDESAVTVAARFDSGIDLLSTLGLSGGMPTRVSVHADKLADVLRRLGVDPD
ncbi:MAG: hypothetical protein ACPGUV_11640 [Polyangiales bacterium]